MVTVGLVLRIKSLMKVVVHSTGSLEISVSTFKRDKTRIFKNMHLSYLIMDFNAKKIEWLLQNIHNVI